MIKKYTKLFTFFKKVSMMVITTLLVFSQLLHANGMADQITNQPVKISFGNEPLQSALDKLEKQSNVKFSYNPADLKGYNVTSHKFQNEPLGKVLNYLFAKTHLSFKEINSGIIIYDRSESSKASLQVDKPGVRNVNNASADEITVTGKVSDSNGPLPGVSVGVEGTSKGVISNAAGNYTLKVSSDAVLTFSSIGYKKQRIPVNNQTVINVIMVSDLKSLNDVIVVGYGVQKKSDVTGSIVSVNEQALRDIPASNIGQALQGQAAGVDIQKSGGNSHPGATPSILIRGTRSINASNSPLIVVDGIPFNGSLNDINPDDIISLEVLKDASSTAIYGSRGANGVLLVSTRRGKKGGTTVSYSGYAGFNKPMGNYNIMNGSQFEDLKKWGLINGNPGKYTGIDDPAFLTDGSFAPQEVASIKTGRSTDWQKLIYKTGFVTDHQLGVSGGNDLTQYAISGGYYNETGIYFGQSFVRYSLKLSVDQQLGKNVKIGLSTLNTLSYTNGENANPLGQALRASPLSTPYDDVTGKLVGFTAGSANQVWNPLANFVPGAVVETRKRFGTFTTAYAEVNLAPGLKYRFNGGAEIRPDIYGNYYAGATTNNLGGASTANNQSTYSYNYTLENILTYDKTFAQKHHVNFTGLYSLQESQSQSNSFSYNNILSDGVQYFNPQYGSNLNGSGSYSKWDIISYMARVNYGYANKYLLTLTMRSDGSSRLAPGNKYHVFPSAAAAWNITQEPILKDSKVLTNLKLRASYGTVGNTAINPYQTLGALSSVNYNFGSTNLTGAYPTSVPNPNLTWEYTSTLNLGLDFGFLDGRITGAVDAYHQYTRSLLLPLSLPPTSGIPNSILTNVGQTQNKGLEISLSSVNIAGNGRNTFSWTTSFNITFNRGKVTKLASGVTQDITNGLFVGQPINAIFDYKKIGIWQNTKADTALAKSLGLTTTGTGSVIGTIRVEDVNKDGKINASDRIILGSDQPKYTGGFTNRIAYKGFDFTIVGVYRVGGTITSKLFQSGSFINTFQGNYNNINEDYWTPTNHQNYYPKPNSASTNTPYSSLLSYFDGTFLKVRSLTLGYYMPEAITKRIKVKSLRVYATAQNPFILFSPYRNEFHGLDPETAGSLNVDTPPTKSFTFGINMTL
ncbi:SusC/RagA family TonB-linked outer membrane protein [Mucilaginibacter sp. NFX135]|uniref:SusC/RagA family TonB-linked outer membrane protein n=1 Tax=Mucilaginibacter sp. NFX135 TaxID=3402687 RepID=UPI003AFB231A